MIHSRNPRWSVDESTDRKADLHVPENAVNKLILDFIMIRAISHDVTSRSLLRRSRESS